MIRMSLLVACALTLGAAVTFAEDTPNFTYTTVDVPGADSTGVLGVNNRGDLVGFYVAAGVQYGFVLRDGVVRTFDPPEPGATVTEVDDISATGVLVWNYNPPGDSECLAPSTNPWGMTYWPITRAFMLHKASMTEIAFPDACYTWANHINARGEVAGEYMVAGKGFGFVWNRGTFRTIDLSESPDELSWSSVRGMNANGDLAGWYGSGVTWTFHAYVMRNGQVTTIDGPGSTWTIADGINARGDVIGWYFDAAFSGHGFVFADGHLSTLDIPGATETYPYDISDNGTIVGYYRTEDTRLHGFILRR